MFDNFDNLEEDHLAFTYRGIIDDREVEMWKWDFRDSFNKAANYFDWN